MTQQLTLTPPRWVSKCLLFIFVFWMMSGLGLAQEEISDIEPDSSELPEEVVQFHRTFLSLYADNYTRITRLETMREAGAEEETQELIGTIQTETQKKLDQLRKWYQSAQGTVSNQSILSGMKNLLKIYSQYIEKIIKQWEPTREQLLKRRRLSQNEIIRRNPELATPSLLRRVFLGELISNVKSVPQLGQWFNTRVSRVDDWLSSKYDDLFPLYIKLLSRLDRVSNAEDSGEEERKRVLQEVRREWKQFWQDVEGASDWQNIRDTVNELRSFFRNRSGRLPGSQEALNEKVKNLQKQIGDMKQLYAEQPFASQENRLQMHLRLAKAFVNRAVQVGNSTASRSISSVGMDFVSDYMNRTPETFWNGKDLNTLQKKKKRELQKYKERFNDLGLMQYKKMRKQYNLPYDAVMQLVQRLGTNFGKKEKEIAVHLREVTQFVRSRYWLSTKGIKLMEAYRNALRDREFEQKEAYVQFEKAFRKEYETELKNGMAHVNRIREFREKLDDRVKQVKRIQPEELAAAYVNARKEQKQSR